MNVCLMEQKNVNGIYNDSIIDKVIDTTRNKRKME